jgi:phosphomannomutase
MKRMPIKISADYNRAFKPTDIRGIYPSEIDEEVTYLVARSFVDEFKFKQVLVARDMRISTPALFEAFCKGVTDAGADVVDVGMVHTPVLYFASGTLSLPGVVITASHSPKEYNGLKLVMPGAIPLTENFGLKQIRRRMEKGKFNEVAKVGKIRTKDFLKPYQRFVLKGMKMKGLESLKVVSDVGNGMAHVLMPLLEEKVPIKFTKMFDELDGRFPNRGSDPTLKNNQRHLAKKIKEGGYDFGIAFDGDADRIAFVDENGRNVNSAIIGILVAKRLLKKHPKSKIVFTALTSRIYEEEIKKAGGVPVPAKVGHSFIKETMRKKDVLFGCEHSGHFYFKDYFFTDSVVLTLRYVLEEYQEYKAKGLTFSKMVEPYLCYYQTEDEVINVKDKAKSLKLAEEFIQKKQPIKIKRFDGVWVDFGEVWGTVKVSVTEYALKFLFESKSKAKAVSMHKEMSDYIKSIANK